MDWKIDIAVIVAIIALLTTILIYIRSTVCETCTRFIDNFDRLYFKTFSLRKQLNPIIQSSSNEDFYYEIDRIWHCEEAQVKVLDYLTEMEDFFFLVIGHRSVYRAFEKLMSLALYQRLSVFYGFILRQRRETGNDRLFLNYEKALVKISRMKKIRAQLSHYHDKCYIGIRSSDRMYDDGYFQSDISMFSEMTNPAVFPIRPNQNQANKYVLPYTVEQINTMVEKDPECRFVFYNGMTAYRLPSDLHRYFICLNPRELLQSLNCKPDMKRWLADCGLPILSYETFLGQEISLNSLRQRFPQAAHYVIQSSSGGGGIGTFLVSAEYFDTGQPVLQPLGQYLVSAYVKHSVSVNTHVFISDKQTVLSPGSIQIIELEKGQLCYHGADFIAFRTLPGACREQIRELSLKIANRLRQRGYRGVAGLDFLVTRAQDVYCMEINPRFQASSFLLDLYLREQTKKSDHNQGERKNNSANSIFTLNEQAFFNQMVTTLCFDDIIDYSCYYYYKGSLPLKYLMVKHDQLRKEQVIVHDDGFLQFQEEKRLNEDSYLFRAVFPHAICAISPDMTLWLNDNIPVRPAPDNLLDMKIALLNQGVRISGTNAQIKKGVYESIDIAYQGQEALRSENPVVMNCAYRVNLSQYSPFAIDAETEGGIVTYYGKRLGHATIEMNQLAALPHIDQRILYLATDRLRIKLIAGCEYKNIGRGCQFCNVPVSDQRFTREEICAALMHLKERQIPFRHILIGGGTCLAPNIWEDVVWLCQFLKADDYYRDKPISLMSILPPKEMLPKFHEAGLEEVAFNIEVSDDHIAQEMMPGKRGQPKAAYYSILTEAVDIFGVGAVRSALLVGLDREDALLDEVQHLARVGVIPCLSAFRALPGSDCAHAMHPDNATLRRIYDRCSECLSTTGGQITELGPKCTACRNNMLAI